MVQTFDPIAARDAQDKLCKDRSLPHFAPSDGICYKCKEDIYIVKTHQNGERSYITGVSVEKATEQLITGCPHCNYSYCE